MFPLVSAAWKLIGTDCTPAAAVAGTEQLVDWPGLNELAPQLTDPAGELPDRPDSDVLPVFVTGAVIVAACPAGTETPG